MLNNVTIKEANRPMVSPIIISDMQRRKYAIVFEGGVSITPIRGGVAAIDARRQSPAFIG